MYKATVTALAYPNGVTAVRLVEGEVLDLPQDFADFLLSRKMIEPTKETKPAEVEKEVKPLGMTTKNKVNKPKRTRKAVSEK